MQSRGMKPDKVTWSTLLSGYALMQDMDGTAKTLSRMDGYSVLSDEWIRKALGRVKNKAALIKAFGNAIGGTEGSGVP
jgi:pentatricopeptide repeat protein